MNQIELWETLSEEPKLRHSLCEPCVLVPGCLHSWWSEPAHASSLDHLGLACDCRGLTVHCCVSHCLPCVSAHSYCCGVLTCPGPELPQRLGTWCRGGRKGLHRLSVVPSAAGRSSVGRSLWSCPSASTCRASLEVAQGLPIGTFSWLPV